LEKETQEALTNRSHSQRTILFTDQDVHLYFWFPLLAGLSELTFDTREQIRHSSLEVLFDILDYHGSTFTTDFWVRIFNSILFPIFDQVGVEATEITTFVKESERPLVDAWLYETCTKCLHHVIDLFTKFYGELRGLLPQIVAFLNGFIGRNHENIASMGVAAFQRLLLAIGDQVDAAELETVFGGLRSALLETKPAIEPLLHCLEDESEGKGGGPAKKEHQARARSRSLTEGSGARRLANLKCKIAVQVLLAKCVGETYQSFKGHFASAAKVALLDLLKDMVRESKAVNLDIEQRARLIALQANCDLEPNGGLRDPPLLELEKESFHIFLGVLMDLALNLAESEGDSLGKVSDSLVEVCVGELETFLEMSSGKIGGDWQDWRGLASVECNHRREILEHSLKALLDLPEPLFRRNITPLFTKLSELIKCEYATPQTLHIVSKIFSSRILKFISQ